MQQIFSHIYSDVEIFIVLLAKIFIFIYNSSGSDQKFHTAEVNCQKFGIRVLYPTFIYKRNTQQTYFARWTVMQCTMLLC